MGAIARSIGEQTFLPFAEECLQFTLNLANGRDDPDLRKCAYGVFASVATVLKDQTGSALPAIVPLLLKAVESTEGVTLVKENGDDDTLVPNLMAGEDDEENEDVSPMIVPWIIY